MGGWSWDMATNVQEWSDESYRIFGFQPGEVSPDYDLFMELVHPDDRARITACAEELLKCKVPFNTDYRILRRDGSLRHVHAEAEIACDETGRPIRMFGINQDITERKLAEERIAHLASFPELNNNPILEITYAGNINYANLAAIKIFPDLEVMGCNHPIFSNFGRLKAELEMSETKSLVREIKFQDKYYQEAITSIPEWGVIRFYLEDTTERNKAEEELKTRRPRPNYTST